MSVGDLIMACSALIEAEKWTRSSQNAPVAQAWVAIAETYVKIHEAEK